MARRKPPRTQFDCSNRRTSLGLPLDDRAFMIGRPLYKVTINAPMMDTMVPIHLARLLWVLKSSFSILQQPFHSSFIIHIFWKSFNVLVGNVSWGTEVILHIGLLISMLKLVHLCLHISDVFYISILNTKYCGKHPKLNNSKNRKNTKFNLIQPNFPCLQQIHYQ